MLYNTLKKEKSFKRREELFYSLSKIVNFLVFTLTIVLSYKKYIFHSHLTIRLKDIHWYSITLIINVSTIYSSPKSAIRRTGGVMTSPTFIYSPQPILTPFCAKNM